MLELRQNDSQMENRQLQGKWTTKRARKMASKDLCRIDMLRDLRMSSSSSSSSEGGKEDDEVAFE